MDKEVFKDIKGFEGFFQISNYGRVKRLYRLSSDGRVLKEKFKKLSDNGTGYNSVCFRIGGVTTTRKVHQLVAEAFLGHTRCGMEMVVNHKDFNRMNNNVKNLEIVTPRENANKKHLKSSSKYTGVSWSKVGNKWHSYISIKDKKIHLGSFINEYDAHLAYQKALAEITL